MEVLAGITFLGAFFLSAVWLLIANMYMSKELSGKALAVASLILLPLITLGFFWTNILNFTKGVIEGMGVLEFLGIVVGGIIGFGLMLAVSWFMISFISHHMKMYDMKLERKKELFEEEINMMKKDSKEIDYAVKLELERLERLQRIQDMKQERKANIKL